MMLSFSDFRRLQVLEDKVLQSNDSHYVERLTRLERELGVFRQHVPSPKWRDYRSSISSLRSITDAFYKAAEIEANTPITVGATSELVKHG